LIKQSCGYLQQINSNKKTMLKQILLVSMLGASFMANAQFGKMMKNLENKANGVASEELPKGVELYTETHTDSMGFSGKYYTKYPVKLSVLNAMNMPKYFNVSEVTLELRQASLSGVFHFIKDESGQKNEKRKHRHENGC
jgi:hypothetical protein